MITIRRIPEHPSTTGGRLGRHVEHDSRSWRFLAPEGVVASVLHTRTAPVFDQGALGSCTGNAIVGALGTDPITEALNGHFVPTLDESLAKNIYSQAEILDGGAGLPTEDEGSSGLSVAKVATQLGFLSGYTHAPTLNAALTALQTVPVITGVNWYDSFDNPSSSGLVTISANAAVRGGHEFEVLGVDVTAKTVRAVNSWGPTWGDKGYFDLSFDTWTRLLAEQGDVTVPVPLTVAPPVPIPVASPADVLLWAQLAGWARARHVTTNKAAADDVIAWAKAKGLT